MPKLALCLVIAEIGGGSGNYPDIGLPMPQPPGGGGGEGNYPDQGLPGGPVHPWFPGHLGGIGGPRPDQGLPGGRPPHVGGRPPGQGVNLPSHPIYRPDKPTPPGQSPGGGLWVIAYVPGQGFKWVSVTPGVPEKPTPLPPDPETPTTPPTVDNTLPETAEPKA